MISEIFQIDLKSIVLSGQTIGSFPVGVAQFPTTTKRPIWPPPVPTHPTALPSTQITTQYPNTVNDEAYVGNYCGSKNGKQDQERIVGGSEGEFLFFVVTFNLI